jgi:molecular chaperone DnaK
VQRGQAEGLIKDLRDALQQEDQGRMRSLSEQLQQVMGQIAQSSYTEEQPQGAASGNKPGDENVVEGDYTVE